MKKRLFAALLYSLTGLFPAPVAAQPAGATSVGLKPGRVFDPGSSQVHDGWVVVVTGNRIAAAGPASEVRAPAGAQVVELPGTTLLPGLIDAHSHLFLHPYNAASW